MEKAVSLRYNLPPDGFNIRKFGINAMDPKSDGNIFGKCLIPNKAPLTYILFHKLGWNRSTEGY